MKIATNTLVDPARRLMVALDVNKNVKMNFHLPNTSSAKDDGKTSVIFCNIFLLD